MSVLPIITFPNMLLKKQSQPVVGPNPKIRRFVQDMIETMSAANGIGLAAVQVAKPERILVVDVGKMRGEAHESHPLCLINPEIVSARGKVLFEEGCLSCPQLHIEIERAEAITMKAIDEHGEPIELDANGLLAIALQHELDHLNGILLVDRLSRLKRDSYKRTLLKLDV